MKSRAVFSALAAAFILTINYNISAAQEIKAVYGRQVSFYRGELIWFVEGINETELGYDDGSYDQYQHVTEEHISPAAAVKLDSLHPPLYVKSAKIFIVNVDHFPNYPGDQYTPFFLSLHADSTGLPGSILGEQDLVGASGDWQSGGMWVKAEKNILLERDSVLWVMMQWQPEFPTAPMFGLDKSIVRMNSFYSYVDLSGDRIWDMCSWGQYMMRAEALQNDIDGGVTLSPGAMMPDSFRVYSSGQPLVTPSDEYYDTTIVNSLHCRVKLPGPENYFCLTSFAGGQESETSEIIMIEGSSTESADVRFEPDSMEIVSRSPNDTSLVLVMTNKNGGEINYRISQIEIASEKQFSEVTVEYTPSEGRISDDLSDTILVSIATSPDAFGDYSISTEFELWDSAQGYLKERYRIMLHIEELTGAEDDYSAEPDGFYLGQNYPNPFNNETIIPYKMPRNTGEISVEIINLRGELVRKLVLRNLGNGFIRWDGCGKPGNKLPSGIYFLRVNAANFRETRKMMLLK
ncbi:MAG TPA: T9SS type A sorting domain-containing protein [candidate division Zixibacteria bacterium]|nr:T9SS type A sorting domain-containing protein [candidate division Zixibacteria bacterium]HER00495.1 T9SS type A sorting domain-containing protein [candidate division Zixibacteria bacterium]